mgnify:CR=1 FL=1
MSRAATAASATAATTTTHVVSSNVDIWSSFLLQTREHAENTTLFLDTFEIDDWDEDKPEIENKVKVSRPVFNLAGKFLGTQTREQSLKMALQAAVDARMWFLVTRHLDDLNDKEETRSYYENKSEVSHVTLMKMVLIGTETIKMSQTEQDNVVRAVNRMIEDKTEYLTVEQYDEAWQWDRAFQQAKRVVVSEDKRVQAETEAWEKKMAKQVAPAQLEATDSDTEPEAET